MRSRQDALWLYLLVGARKTELLAARWEDVDEERRELRLPQENTKAGRTHYVPLSEAALSVIRAIPREEGNPFIFVGAKAKSHLVNINKPWTAIHERAALALWREDPKLRELIEKVKEEVFEKEVPAATARKKRLLTKDEREKLRREPTAKEVQAAASVELPTGQFDVWIHDLRRTVGSWLATNGESLPLIGKVLNHADVKTTAIYARLAEDPARRAMEEHGKRIMEAAQGLRVVK
ncbi:MAG: tyrosine-type recombinase/integrase [Deltaproteobacteria bacterium]|nr:tyrosine-type recombinase/integrase [Deltaproteobacteria bacterium]